MIQVDSNLARVPSTGRSASGQKYEIERQRNQYIFESWLGSTLSQSNRLPRFVRRVDTTNTPMLSWYGSSNLQNLLVDPTLAKTVMIGLLGIGALTWSVPEIEDQSRVPAQIAFKDVEVSVEALNFCARNKIVHILEEGIELVRTFFSPNAKMRVTLGRDPEDLDEYAVIELGSSGDPEADLEAYFKYADEWSKMVEWPASRMVLLDLKVNLDMAK